MKSYERRDRRGGQTLIISIMIMFILAIIATLFVAIVARNLIQSGRSAQSDAVAQIAAAGINYADQMLTSSEDGADWRPIPDNLGCSDGGNFYTGDEPQPENGWQDMREDYPDFKWLRPYWPEELGDLDDEGIGYAGPTGGFTCFNSGRGRYLLRVSYNPNMSDPLSKYIKIESIGRWGIFDPEDPTTYKATTDYKMKRELTAYKPIGITDYVRFVTNKNNKPMAASLGVPNFATDYGRSTNSRYGLRGAPIRVNGDLKWYGNYGNNGVNVYLRGLENDDGGDPLPLDKVEVAGEISADADTSGNNKVPVTINTIVGGRTRSVAAADSDTGDFTTASGFYRDGDSGTDAYRYARGVKRIEPPSITKKDLTNTSTRYRMLTLSSGEYINVGGKQVNLGKYGWGRGVYIDNEKDDQSDSFSLYGRYTVRVDWLNPNNNMTKSAWLGPYYIPPAAVITLVPDDSEQINVGGKNITQYYFYITKDTSDGSVWHDAAGNERPDWGKTIRMPYPDPKQGRVLTRAVGANGNVRIDGNGVIYAEGNVRVRGMLPPGMNLTIVSGKTIYIDGNILKYRDDNPTANDPYRGADPTCGIALLAKDNICVNTTQFLSPDNITVDEIDSSAGDATSPVLVLNQNSRFISKFEFGPYESENGRDNKNRNLMLRHAGQGGASYINGFINREAIEWNTKVSDMYPLIWGVGDPRFDGVYGYGSDSAMLGQVFDITDDIRTNLYELVGKTNTFEIALDKVYTRENYVLSSAAIVPNDVRIEAIMYAQDGCFFVIPGRWFNSDSSDIPGRDRPAGTDEMFPYYGEPLDIKITIDGAVAENATASIGDVTQWSEKWCGIPAHYGSSSTTTAHAGDGITFLYDDHAGWPLRDLNDPTSAVRVDYYGRVLPLAPKLPVCGSLIYSGDIM
ncbi:MAG: hypothetical protein IJT09_03890 [Abditibacteriota bacterium]|nr:hypothetical protein [Abditibacteriota bacterium]